MGEMQNKHGLPGLIFELAIVIIVFFILWLNI